MTTIPVGSTIVPDFIAGTAALDSLESAVRAFQASPNAQTAALLQGLRCNLVEYVLQHPTDTLQRFWLDVLRPKREALKEGGLRELRRSGREYQLLEELRNDLSRGWAGQTAARAAIAGMFLAYAYELPLPAPLLATPNWLRQDWAAFLLEMPQLFNREGEADTYATHLLQVFRLFHHEIENHPDDPATRELATFFLQRTQLIQGYFNDRNLREVYQLRGDIIARWLSLSGFQSLYAFPPRFERKGRIRAGIYVQMYLPDPETHFTIAALDFLDREQFEVILYTGVKTGHPLEQHAASRCDRFTVLPEGYALQAQSIRDDDLDILLIGTNMTAVTNPATLLGAHRLARIQVASESSPVTTGLHSMDVLLSAQWNTPRDDAPDHYTELLYRMPGSNNVYAYQYDRDNACIYVTRETLGLTQEQIVFFSAANYFKTLPELSVTWARILAQVPNSALVLMPYNPFWTRSYLAWPFETRIRTDLSNAGVDPARLKILAPVPNRADLHRVIALSDICLDPHPFSGACSTLDTLVAGVPLVAHVGKTNRSAHSASMLRQIGMQETVAESADAYVALAVQLAQDRLKREQLSSRLKAAPIRENPPFQDTQAYSKRVGDAFTELVGTYDEYYRELSALSPDQLLARIAALVPDGMVFEAGLSSFNDASIIQCLLVPFFRAHANPVAGSRMIDVGACFGQMALPFLTQGWEAHLFEPDPDSRQVLENNTAPFGPKARVIAAAVSNKVAASVSFHKSRTRGLSGLSASPYGETAQLIDVPCVRLADYCAGEGIDHVDFLKIDAEGHDFEVFESLDLSRVTPRIVMLEFGTSFAGQTRALMKEQFSRIKERGYHWIIFAYDDDSNMRHGVWSYRIKRVLFDVLHPDTSDDWFGNILFFREGDTEFLLTLHAFLDSTRPRRASLSRLDTREAETARN